MITIALMALDLYVDEYSLSVNCFSGSFLFSLLFWVIEVVAIWATILTCTVLDLYRLRNWHCINYILVFLALFFFILVYYFGNMYDRVIKSSSRDSCPLSYRAQPTPFIARPPSDRSPAKQLLTMYTFNNLPRTVEQESLPSDPLPPWLSSLLSFVVTYTLIALIKLALFSGLRRKREKEEMHIRLYSRRVLLADCLSVEARTLPPSNIEETKAHSVSISINHCDGDHEFDAYQFKGTRGRPVGPSQQLYIESTASVWRSR